MECQVRGHRTEMREFLKSVYRDLKESNPKPRMRAETEFLEAQIAQRLEEWKWQHLESEYSQ